jgi:lipopolysaccharide export system permease protein
MATPARLMKAPSSRTTLPRHVLARHFSRTLLARSALSGGILLSLMEILSLLEQTNPILERHLGATGIVTYALLHLPALAATALPLAVMIGALFTLTQMTLGSEIASLRAAGLSTPAMYRLMLPGMAIMAAFGLILQDRLAPEGELLLARWWSVTDPLTCDTAHDFWFRDGPHIIHVGGYGDAGARLCNVTAYSRDASGNLTDARAAPDLRYNQGVWRAPATRSLLLATDRTRVSELHGAATFALAARPDEILALAQPYPALTTPQLFAALGNRRPTALPHSDYAMMLLTRLLLPITLCVMLLLAVPVVYIPPRTGTGSWLPVYCLGGGFVFVVIQGLFQALGEAGTLPVALAALAAPLLAGLAGIAVVLRMEER